jgi:hypothetical protein
MALGTVIPPNEPLRFASHSKLVQQITTKHGWLPAARYTNLRDVKSFARVGFVDIDWKNYNFSRHLEAVKSVQPEVTVARDIESIDQLGRVLDEAAELSLYASKVVIVPKCLRLAEPMEEVIPPEFILGFSTPTKYGGTAILPERFRRPVHLLGGAPKAQLRLASQMNVISFDCNRFTLDARFGDYFDGETFRPHPIGGYARCLEDSVLGINAAWTSLNNRRKAA